MKERTLCFTQPYLVTNEGLSPNYTTSTYKTVRILLNHTHQMVKIPLDRNLENSTQVHPHILEFSYTTIEPFTNLYIILHDPHSFVSIVVNLNLDPFQVSSLLKCFG